MRATRTWLLALLAAAVASLGPAPAWVWAAFGGAALCFAAGLGRRERSISGALMLASSASLTVPLILVGLAWRRIDPDMPWAAATATLLILPALPAFAGFRRSPIVAQGILYLTCVGIFTISAGPLASSWTLPALAAGVLIALGAFLSADQRQTSIGTTLTQGAAVLGVAVPLFLVHPLVFGTLHEVTQKIVPDDPADEPWVLPPLGFSQMPLGVIAGHQQDPTPLMVVHIDEGLEHLPMTGPLPTLYLRGNTMDTYRNGEWTSEFPRSLPQTSPTRWLEVFPVADTGAAVSGAVMLVNDRTTDTFFVPNEPTGLEGEWFETNRHHDVRVPRERAPVTGYRFSSRVTSKNSQVLLPDAKADPTPEDRELFGLDEALRQIVAEWVAPEAGPYLRARQICDRLREPGLFKYRLDRPPIPTGEDATVHFLTVSRAGECREFASSATLLMRAAGVPARLVVGFVSTEFDPTTRNFRVRIMDAHAWVEIHLETYGWVTLDPTPPPEKVDLGTRVVPVPPRPQPTAPPPPTWDEPIKTYEGRDIPWRVVLPALLLFLLAGFVGSLLVHRRVQAAQVTRRERPAATALPLLNEFLRMMRRLGHAPRAGETLDTFAGRLPARLPRAAVESLVTLYHAARFGGRPLDPASARAALAGLRQALFR